MKRYDESEATFHKIVCRNAEGRTVKRRQHKPFQKTIKPLGAGNFKSNMRKGNRGDIR